MEFFGDLARTLIEEHPLDTAKVLERLEPSQAWAALSLIKEPYRADILEGFNPAYAAQVLRQADDTSRLGLVRELPSDISTDILQFMEDAERQAILDALPSLHAEKIHGLTSYEAETVGSIMALDYVALRAEATVRDALTRLRRLAKIGTAVNYVYVVGEAKRLEGVLMMRDLVLAHPETRLERIMIRDIQRVYATESIEDVAERFLESGLFALPVVSDSEELVGVLLATQIASEMQDEGFEDAQKMFGAGAEEHASSSAWYTIRQRLPWLLVNLVTAFAAAAVVGAFEGIIAQITILAAFLPVVAGQGGNAGAQALAVMLRALALDEVDPHKPRRVLIKEGIVGIVNGVVTGIAAGVIAALVSQNIVFGIVIVLAMSVNLLIAGIAGAGIPVLMERFGQDPAQSSNIILTTVTDIFGFASFLGLAVVFKAWLL